MTRSIRGFDLVQAREEYRRRRVALRLVARQAPLRRLALAFLADRELRSRVGVGAALGGDLLRLGLLRAQQSGRPASSDRFVVTPVVQDRTTLTLVSTTPDARPAEHAGPAESLAPLEQPEPPTVLWNHTAIGPLVFLRRGESSHVGLQVGYHRVIGQHHFALLGAMARRHPDLVREVLRPLLEDPVSLDEGSGSLPTPRRWLPRPRLGLRPRLRLAAAAAATCAGPVGRRVLPRWLLRSRGEVPARELLADLLKLDALRAACAGRIAGVERVVASLVGDELCYISNGTLESPADRPPEAPGALLWDHSRVGSSVSFRRVDLSLGGQGTHRFEALERVLEHAVPRIWQALLPKPEQAGTGRGETGVADA